jgi:hypothetical protein
MVFFIAIDNNYEPLSSPSDRSTVLQKETDMDDDKFVTVVDNLAVKLNIKRTE